MIPADPWAGLGPATIIRGDALNLPIPDGSVDLIVTSPPYFALRSYQDGGQHYDGQIGSEATPDEFVSSLLAATREMVRVLKPSGSLWVNLGDKYASNPGQGFTGMDLGTSESRTAALRRDYRRGRRPASVPQKSLIGVPWRYALRCIDELGLILRAEVVWSKPNGLPESVTDRVRRSHETWFHFTVSPRYFAAVDEIRDAYSPNKPWGTPSSKSAQKAMSAVRGSEDHQRGLDAPVRVENPLGKLPGSVREVPTAPLRVPAELGVDHFAAFPPAWPAWIIRGWSPSGVCVECGEGRRPVVAREATTARRRGYSADSWNAGSGVVRGAQQIDVPRAQGENVITTITGYACACPTPDAPTRPAVILDPFGGTGTTAMAARALGRHGISVDLSMDYCRLARWRVQDPDQLATVRGLPRQGKPADQAQPSLLDLFGDEATA